MCHETFSLVNTSTHSFKLIRQSCKKRLKTAGKCILLFCQLSMVSGCVGINCWIGYQARWYPAYSIPSTTDYHAQTFAGGGGNNMFDSIKKKFFSFRFSHWIWQEHFLLFTQFSGYLFQSEEALTSQHLRFLFHSKH